MIAVSVGRTVAFVERDRLLEWAESIGRQKWLYLEILCAKWAKRALRFDDPIDAVAFKLKFGIK